MKMKECVKPLKEMLNVFIITDRVVKMLSLMNNHARKNCSNLREQFSAILKPMSPFHANES